MFLLTSSLIRVALVILEIVQNAFGPIHSCSSFKFAFKI